MKLYMHPLTIALLLALIFGVAMVDLRFCANMVVQGIH
jgi:hypothetical protein